MAHKSPIYQFLDTVGDGSGSTEANINLGTFKFKPGAGEIAEIHRMVVHIDDGSAFSADSYGNVVGPLTNGVLVEVRRASDDSVLIDLTSGEPIKSNGDWSHFAYDLDIYGFTGGRNIMAVRWTFAKGGEALKLSQHEYLAVQIQDDLSTLTDHKFFVHGRRI